MYTERLWEGSLGLTLLKPSLTFINIPSQMLQLFCFWEEKFFSCVSRCVNTWVSFLIVFALIELLKYTQDKMVVVVYLK